MTRQQMRARRAAHKGNYLETVIEQASSTGAAILFSGKTIRRLICRINSFCLELGLIAIGFAKFASFKSRDMQISQCF